MDRYSGTHGSTLALAGALGLVSTFTATTAHAQTAPAASNDTIEEIIVTAERRNESVQRTGASVSVRSGDDLL